MLCLFKSLSSSIKFQVELDQTVGGSSTRGKSLKIHPAEKGWSLARLLPLLH